MAKNAKSLSPYYLLRDAIDPPDYAATPFDEEERSDLRGYVRTLYKHRWTIVTAIVVCVSTAATRVFMQTPVYTAKATLQIEREAPKLAPVEGVNVRDPQAFDFYQTQYQVLQSWSIAARVIRELDLIRDPRLVGQEEPALFRAAASRIRSFIPLPQTAAGREREDGQEQDGGSSTPHGLPNDVILRYLAGLSIQPVIHSRLVDVAYTHSDPRFAARIANHHAQAYIAATIEQRLELTGVAKNFLEEELAKAKDRMIAAEAALNYYRKEKGVVSLEGEPTDIVTARLVDLNDRLMEAEARRTELESHYHLVQERRYVSIPAVANDTAYRQLSQRLAGLRADRAELEQLFKPTYPKLAELIAREREVAAQLQSKIRGIVSVIESEFIAAKDQEQSLRRQLEEQRRQALEQKDISTEYHTLDREVNTAQSLYVSLLERLRDMDVAEEVRVSNSWLIDPAAPPTIASAPNKRRALLLASILGLGLGVGIALMRERLDDTVKTPDDVQRRLRLAILGVVPCFQNPALVYAYGYGGPRNASRAVKGVSRRSLSASSKNGHGRGVTNEIVVGAHPCSAISDAYRAIRTAILLSTPDDPPRVLLVTSSSAGEGKSVTAVNEAVALAQSGARVLLVDADVRQSRLRRMFDLPSGNGLTSYLAGHCTLASTIYPSLHKGTHPGPGAAEGTNGDGAHGQIFVLPSGPLPPNPTELLGSPRMRQTLESLREAYDFVILDSPPALPITDAVVLSTMADGVLLVVRGQKTPTKLVIEASRRLAMARARILGVVLNNVDVTSGDYYEYDHYYYS